MSFQSKLEDSWRQQNLLTLALLPLSLVYRAVLGVREFGYKIGLLKSYRAPVPVIVVGNLTVGGTGKTPLIVYLAQKLKEAGYQPGIISRGYRSKAPEYPYLVEPRSPVSESGDEPALIARKTGLPLVIGANRSLSIKKLIADHGVDLILSDDGLQHYALQRDIEVCITNQSLENANSWLLPAGPYREPKSRLKRFSFIVSDQASSELGRYQLKIEAQSPKPLLKQKENQKPNFDSSAGVHLVAGIAQPQRFFESCAALGIQGPQHIFPDHHNFQKSDLEFGDNLPVLMTEKDAVKCEHFAQSNHWSLGIDAKLEPNLADDIIAALKAKAST